MKRWQIYALVLIGIVSYLSITKKGQIYMRAAIQTITNAGISLLSKLEGKRNTVYQDEAGKWTIGIGHLIQPGEIYYPYGTVRSITDNDVNNLLQSDLSKATSIVQDNVIVPLTSNQFDALTSFVFNTGAGNFLASTLLKKLNAGDYAGASNELDRWVYVTKDGKKNISSNLETRREVEKKLFMSA